MNQINSIWKDENDSYYKLPDSSILPVGEIVIYNCLNQETKKVDKFRLNKYKISLEEAEGSIKELIEEGIFSLSDYLAKTLSNSNNISLEGTNGRQLNFNPKQIDWLKIVCECLDITPNEINSNPKLLERKVHKLLIDIANVFSTSSSSLPLNKSEAKKSLLKIQEVLSSNQLDLGNLLTDLSSFMREEQENKNGDLSQNKYLKLPPELKTLIDDIRKNAQLKDIITSVIEREQKAKDCEEQTVSEVEYTESAKAAFRDILEEHPLPALDFNSLLENN